VRVFIVHAHHEPESFNGSLTRTATVALQETGHTVKISDLYRMGFDPVSDRRNFRGIADASRLKQQLEEEHASSTDGYVPELQAEMDKLEWCDTLVLQFPLWWLGMPAILKGWFDRVFAVGRAYGGGRYYSRGVFLGKRAMCSVTVGGSAPMYSDLGAYGPLDIALHPIHHGILAFVGFSILEPFVVYAPARLSNVERNRYLQKYRERVRSLEAAPAVPPLDLIHYDGLIRRSPSSPVFRA
jgi:NAD(P)H dehydrogenase (quinone)